MSKPSSFELETQIDGDRATVIATGELDMATAPRLDETIDELLAAGSERLRIDLSGLTFADSSGLRLLLETANRSAVEGWSLQIVRPGEAAFAVFRISGAEDHLPFVDR